MTPAERQKRYRARNRRGKAVLRIPVTYYATVEALIRSGRLSEAEAEDRARVEVELSEIVHLWAREWL